ncbi:hypothetical protein M8C21_029674, partial [Ambrosia artemisiifolia]
MVMGQSLPRVHSHTHTCNPSWIHSEGGCLNEAERTVQKLIVNKFVKFRKDNGRFPANLLLCKCNDTRDVRKPNELGTT